MDLAVLSIQNRRVIEEQILSAWSPQEVLNTLEKNQSFQQKIGGDVLQRDSQRLNVPVRGGNQFNPLEKSEGSR